MQDFWCVPSFNEELNCFGQPTQIMNVIPSRTPGGQADDYLKDPLGFFRVFKVPSGSIELLRGPYSEALGT